MHKKTGKIRAQAEILESWNIKQKSQPRLPLLSNDSKDTTEPKPNSLRVVWCFSTENSHAVPQIQSYTTVINPEHLEAPF